MVKTPGLVLTEHSEAPAPSGLEQLAAREAMVDKPQGCVAVLVWNATKFHCQLHDGHAGDHQSGKMQWDSHGGVLRELVPLSSNPGLTATHGDAPPAAWSAPRCENTRGGRCILTVQHQGHHRTRGGEAWLTCTWAFDDGHTCIRDATHSGAHWREEPGGVAACQWCSGPMGDQAGTACAKCIAEFNAEHRAKYAASTPQPAPSPGTGPSMHDLAVRDLVARKEFGLKKYGTILQADNGRDHLVDALQEGLDGVVYLEAAIIQRDMDRARIAVLEAALTQIAECQTKGSGWDAAECSDAAIAALEHKPS